MSVKHFLHDPIHLVQAALHSITLTNPSVAFDSENKIVYRRPGHASQVSIISGGGSGHEPSFAAFVGDGLLSAAVAGTIFASPSAEQIRKALMGRVDTDKGVVVTVMNYTGDVLNFGVAVEKAKAAGLNVEMVVVGDDVGVGRLKGGKVGRRGIAGTVLVHKISGALAATGASLQEVHKVTQLAADNVISVGASLSHVHVPGRAIPDADFDEVPPTGEVEIGMGIHNEAGSLRVKADLPSLVRSMLAQLLDWKDEDRAFLRIESEDQVVLLVNNLGGVSVLEMGGIVTEVALQLERDYGIKPVRLLSGIYMTSLNGLGFSITLLKVKETGGKSMLELLDAPAEATGWSAVIKSKTWENKPTEPRQHDPVGEEEIHFSGLKLNSELAKKALRSALSRVIAVEPEVTKYDTVVGDGDCGIGLKRGAEGVLSMLSSTQLPNDAVAVVGKITRIVETEMDGTSGAIYAIFLNALAHALRDQSKSFSTVTPQIWAAALGQSMASLGRYTPARPGDRTLMDALHPFVETLASTGDVKKAAEASRKGAETTKGMKASLGRTVYVGGEGWQDVPDPGAWGLSEFLLGLADDI